MSRIQVAHTFNSSSHMVYHRVGRAGQKIMCFRGRRCKFRLWILYRLPQCICYNPKQWKQFDVATLYGFTARKNHNSVCFKILRIKKYSAACKIIFLLEFLKVSEWKKWQKIYLPHWRDFEPINRGLWTY